jgi:CubicO group peptidase (beta-lactamase class C family)
MDRIFQAVFLVIFFPPFLFGQQIDIQQLDDYLKNEMKGCQIPGLAVGIIQNGEIVYCKGFGKNTGASSQLDAESPFILASLTKSFTGLAISQLESQGKLRYTDKVRDHLPFFSLKDTDYQDSITIDHLLNHRSGIPGISSYKTNYKEFDLEEKARRLRNIKGTGRLGHFEYANDNYALLGLIIEKVSQVSYQEYVQKHILNPLQLSNTYFSQQEATPHNMAKGHQLYFGFPRRSHITYHQANLPNGGMLSSATDLCKYLQGHLSFDANEKPVIAALDKKNDLFETSHEDIYRKGWFISEYKGKRFYSHGGQLSDYRNFMGFFPDEKIGLVVLMNQHSLFLNERIGQIPENILSFLFADPLPKNNSKLNTAYWIFITLSMVVVVFLVFSLIKVIRSHQFTDLSSQDLNKAQWSILIGNFIIPIAMMSWMWYLANDMMTSLHLAQPDILFIVQLFFSYLLIVGVVRIYQIKKSIKPE